jgi:hypothetical protein
MKKLNQKGFAHWVVPALVVVLIAAVGTRVLLGSHADVVTQSSKNPNVFSNRYLTINPTQGGVTFQHGDPNDSIIPNGAQFSGVDLYQVGFTITDKTALAYKLTQFTGGANGGFYSQNGNLTPGQTTNVIVDMNPDIVPNGIYNYTAQLQYEVPATNLAKPPHWVAKEVSISLTATLTGQPYLDYINVQPLSVSEELNRSNVSPTTGLILGQPIEVIAQNQLTGYEVDYLTPTQGQGFYQSSGGLGPHQAVGLQTYINPSSKANGVYNGQAIIKYQSYNGQWLNGPTVNYNINLAN